MRFTNSTYLFYHQRPDVLNLCIVVNTLVPTSRLRFSLVLNVLEQLLHLTTERREARLVFQRFAYTTGLQICPI